MRRMKPSAVQELVSQGYRLGVLIKTKTQFEGCAVDVFRRSGRFKNLGRRHGNALCKNVFFKGETFMRNPIGIGSLVRITAVLFVLCAAPSQYLAASRAEAPLKKASLLPQWSAQAQFAGYMVALDKGFYRKAGIDLTILEGGPHKPPAEWLQIRQGPFSVPSGSAWPLSKERPA